MNHNKFNNWNKTNKLHKTYKAFRIGKRIKRFNCLKYRFLKRPTRLDYHFLITFPVFPSAKSCFKEMKFKQFNGYIILTPKFEHKRANFWTILDVFRHFDIFWSIFYTYWHILTQLDIIRLIFRHCWDIFRHIWDTLGHFFGHLLDIWDICSHFDPILIQFDTFLFQLDAFWHILDEKGHN